MQGLRQWRILDRPWIGHCLIRRWILCRLIWFSIFCRFPWAIKWMQGLYGLCSQIKSWLWNRNLMKSLSTLHILCLVHIPEVRHLEIDTVCYWHTNRSWNCAQRRAKVKTPRMSTGKANQRNQLISRNQIFLAKLVYIKLVSLIYWTGLNWSIQSK